MEGNYCAATSNVVNLLRMATAGYSGKSVSEKFCIKPGMDIVIIKAPKGFLNLIAPLPEKTRILKNTNAPADMIICFVHTPDDLQLISTFPNQLNEKGMVWMCWAKKTSALFAGVTEDMIRNTALQYKLVDIKVCAVDENYSGLKIVRRKS